MSTASTKPLLTFVIIATDDGSHETEYAALENDILKQKNKGRVRYIMYKYDTNKDVAVSKQLYVTPLGKPYFKVKPEPAASNRKFYEPQTLIKFLKTADAVEKAPKHRYILITWGHGSGLGFFAKIDKTIAELLPEKWDSQTKNYFIDTLNYEIERFSFYNANMSLYDAASQQVPDSIRRVLDSAFIPHSDEAGLDKEKLYNNVLKKYKAGITAATLSEIIHKGLRKVEMLICMNCFVQMVETGYFLKDRVKILVAGQSTIPFNGYNYEKLFQYVNQNPDLDIASIAQNIMVFLPVKYYKNPYHFINEQGVDTVFDINTVHVSANDLSKYDKLVSASGVINEYLLSKQSDLDLFNSVLTNVVRPARNRCHDITLRKVDVIDVTTYYDYLITYAQLIKPSVVSRELRGRYKTFLRNKFEVVIASYGSPLLFESTDNPTHTFYSPKSLSVFFPVNTIPSVLEFRNLLLCQPNVNKYFNITKWNMIWDAIK